MSSIPPIATSNSSSHLPDNWSDICESEPLSFSGMIQPHGALLQIDVGGKVTHASANIDHLFPGTSECIGKQLSADFFQRVHTPLDTLLTSSAGERRDLSAIRLAGSGPEIDVVLTRNGEGILIELFSSPHAHSVPAPDPALTRPFPKGLTMDELFSGVVTRIRAITGFDRVMLYAFRTDGDGEVLAEDRNPESYGTYLGLRFPGSDIPQIARELYLKNPWRLIPEAPASPVPIRSMTGNPPDLSCSDLRSVSPVHQAYLANMNVVASLSFPITENRALWGLVACHAKSPTILSLNTLSLAKVVVRNFNMALLQLHAEEGMQAFESLTYRLSLFRDIFSKSENPEDILSVSATLLSSLFEGCGLAFFSGHRFTLWGTTPPPSTIEILHEILESSAQEPIWQTVSLSESFPGIGVFPVAGLMVIRLQRNCSLWIFRSETLQEVVWGGNPQKPVETNASGVPISPRQSFERWVEKRVGQSLPWGKLTHLAALHLIRTTAAPPGSHH